PRSSDPRGAAEGWLDEPPDPEENGPGTVVGAARAGGRRHVRNRCSRCATRRGCRHWSVVERLARTVLLEASFGRDGAERDRGRRLREFKSVLRSFAGGGSARDRHFRVAVAWA